MCVLVIFCSLCMYAWINIFRMSVNLFLIILFPMLVDLIVHTCTKEPPHWSCSLSNLYNIIFDNRYPKTLPWNFLYREKNASLSWLKSTIRQLKWLGILNVPIMTTFGLKTSIYWLHHSTNNYGKLARRAEDVPGWVTIGARVELVCMLMRPVTRV